MEEAAPSSPCLAVGRKEKVPKDRGKVKSPKTEEGKVPKDRGRFESTGPDPSGPDARPPPDQQVAATSREGGSVTPRERENVGKGDGDLGLLPDLEHPCSPGRWSQD